MIDEEIARKVDVKDLLSTSGSFKIADLGCSVGPNTFICMQNVIEAVKRKYQSEVVSIPIKPEFEVFFNDQALNDFNTLFRSVPTGTERDYFAAGVPGSFHGRLYPNSSLHLVHASHALHWLSQIPPQVLDSSSHAWNRAKIFCTTAPKAVYKAYAAQFARDVEIFLDARAKELVSGGFLVLIISSISKGVSPSCQLGHMLFHLLGSTLLDMAKEGIISESQADSFNIPFYITSPEEMTELVERNGHFKIERAEMFDPKSAFNALLNGETCSLHFRASFEEMISRHFGVRL